MFRHPQDEADRQSHWSRLQPQPNFQPPLYTAQQAGMPTLLAPLHHLQPSNQRDRRGTEPTGNLLPDSAGYPPDRQVPLDRPLLPIGPDFQLFASERQQQSHENVVQARRSATVRYSDAEWDRHLPKIKRLYYDDDHTLERTMEIMRQQDGFTPSVTAYKEKLPGGKNLPAVYAQWMSSKAEQRETEESKDTVFEYKGRTWTKERVQKSSQRASIRGVAPLRLEYTPGDVTYRTPPQESPFVQSLNIPSTPLITPQLWTPTPVSGTPQINPLQLVWQGKNRADFQAAFELAEGLYRAEEVANAEEKFREALRGFERLMSPTHSDTLAVAYRLAEFYARMDRKHDADQVLSWVNQKIVARWGLFDANTVNHVEKVIQMYRDWERQEDADALLYRYMELHNQEFGSDSPTSAGDAQDLSLPGVSSLLLQQSSDSRTAAQVLHRRLPHSTEPAVVDFELGRLKAHVKAGNLQIVPELASLVDHCHRHKQKLEIQLLRAGILTIKLLRTSDDEVSLSNELKKFDANVYEAIKDYAKISKSLLEECVGLAKQHVKLEQIDTANDILEAVADAAVKRYDADSPMMLWLCILVGKLFQRQGLWRHARPWFERALAGSLNQFPYSEQTKRLEQALEERDYPYPVPDGSFVPVRRIFVIEAELTEG